MQEQALAEEQERRKFRRMPAQSGSFVVFDNHQTMVGRILDIGHGGLCCQLSGEDPPSHISSITLVGYHHSGDSLSLKDLPLTGVKADETLKIAEDKSWTKVRLEFGDLTPIQRSGIMHFFAA